MQQTDRPSTEDRFELRHRNPLANDFVVVSRVVLIGYPQVSDGAKITYWVIYSHDWYERDRGGRKGYAFPTLGRIAELRHTTDRTIRRHLAELIEAGLLTRELRPGKASVLYIEEPSDQAVHAYLTEEKPRTDIFVRGGRTNLSPHKTDKENQINSVNAVQVKVMEERRKRNSGGLQPIGRLLKTRAPEPAATDRRDWLTTQIIDQTGDRESLGCYRRIAQACPEQLVFEALSLLKEARHDGVVHSRGALFLTIVRRLCNERGIADPIRPAGRPVEKPGLWEPQMAQNRPAISSMSSFPSKQTSSTTGPLAPTIPRMEPGGRTAPGYSRPNTAAARVMNDRDRGSPP